MIRPHSDEAPTESHLVKKSSVPFILNFEDNPNSDSKAFHTEARKFTHVLPKSMPVVLCVAFDPVLETIEVHSSQLPSMSEERFGALLNCLPSILTDLREEAKKL